MSQTWSDEDDELPQVAEREANAPLEPRSVVICHKTRSDSSTRRAQDAQTLRIGYWNLRNFKALRFSTFLFKSKFLNFNRDFESEINYAAILLLNEHYIRGLLTNYRLACWKYSGSIQIVQVIKYSERTISKEYFSEKV